MFIVVTIDGILKAVTNNKGVAREFSKMKKALNFIEGRAYLQDKNPQIVECIDDITDIYKVDI